MGKVRSVQFPRRASRAGSFHSNSYMCPQEGLFSSPTNNYSARVTFRKAGKLLQGRQKLLQAGEKLLQARENLLWAGKNLLQGNEFWPSSPGDQLYSKCTPEEIYSNSEKTYSNSGRVNSRNSYSSPPSWEDPIYSECTPEKSTSNSRILSASGGRVNLL